MKYEYSIKFFAKKTGKCVGISAHTYRSKEDAEYFALDHFRRFPKSSEEARLVRREVGEWEEVSK